MRHERPNTDQHYRAPDVCDSAAPPFWRRLASTSVLIAVAIAAHVWVVPRVDSTGDLPPTPGGAERAQLADASSAASRPGVAEVPVGTRGEPEALVTMTSASLGAAAGTRDSRSIPDGTYPSAGAVVGTSGQLRPALLVKSKPERREATLGERAGERTSVVDVQAIAPAAPLAGAQPDIAPRISPPPPVAHNVPDSPQQDSDDSAATTTSDDGVALDGTMAYRSAPAVIVSRVEEEELVKLVLQEYRAAYERLDAAAAKSVWPTVDAQALRHAFKQLDEQRLNFESCGVSVRGDSASARCRGEAQYLPKVGTRRPLVKAGEWVFDLARRDTAWHIVSAKIQ